MEDSSDFGRVVGQEDIRSFETLMGSPEDEWGEMCIELATGKSRLLRVVIGKGQPTRPRFPEVKIYESLMKRPTSRDIGSRLIPPESAVNFFTKQGRG